MILFIEEFDRFFVIVRRTWAICFFKLATCFERGSSEQHSTVKSDKENKIDVCLPMDWYSFKRWSKTSRRSSKVRSGSTSFTGHTNSFEGNCTHPRFQFLLSAVPWRYHSASPRTLVELVSWDSNPRIDRKDRLSIFILFADLLYRVVSSLLCRKVLERERDRSVEETNTASLLHLASLKNWQFFTIRPKSFSNWSKLTYSSRSILLFIVRKSIGCVMNL